MKKLVILGNGDYSRTLQDVAEQLGYNLLAVLDDKNPDYPLDSFADYISSSSPDDRDSLEEVEKNGVHSRIWKQRISPFLV